MYTQSKTPKEICDFLEIKKWKYNQIVNSEGLAKKSRREYRKEFLVKNYSAEIAMMYEQKISLEKIGLAFKTDKTVIKDVLTENNVRLRLSNKNIDRSGSKRGMLTLAKKTELKNDSGQVLYLCKCDCGNEKLITITDFGYSKSCGCRLNRDFQIKDRELMAIKYAYWDYKKSARRRKFSFELSLEEFKSIVLQSCYYCDKEPSIVETDRSRLETKILRNGIDRKDSSIGYVLENSVPCCSECNYIKNSLSADDLICWIKKVYKNLKKKGIIEEGDCK